MKSRSYKALIFDLDGTLVDSMSDIAVAINKVLKDLHYQPHDMGYYKDKLGWGLRRSLELTLPDLDSAVMDQAMVSLLDYYRKEPCTHTKAYAGISNLVKSLKKRGLELFVYTNKDQIAAERIIKTVFPDNEFTAVFGADGGRPLKPAPEGVRRVIADTGYASCDILYLGDSEVDMETAANGKLDALAVLWGYRSREQLERFDKLAFVDKPDEIIGWII